MLRVILAFLLFAYLPTEIVYAQTYPEYDGVYVWSDEESAWREVKLREVGRVSVSQSSNSKEDKRFLSNQAAGFYYSMGIPVDSSADFLLKRPKSLRLFVRQRSPEISSIVYFVKADEMAKTIVDGSTVTSDGTPPGVVSYTSGGSAGTAQFIFAGQGRLPADFKTRIVDDYSSEYALDPWKDYSVRGFGNCSNCGVLISGFAVLTRDQNLSGEATSAYVVELIPW